LNLSISLLTQIYSLFAQNQIVGYPTWASTERGYVEDLERTRQSDQMSSLNQGTRAAVDSLQVKLERVENEFRVYRVMQDTKFQDLIDSTNRLTQAILRLTNPADDGGVENGVVPLPPPPLPGPPNNQPAANEVDGEDEVLPPPNGVTGPTGTEEAPDPVLPPDVIAAVPVPRTAARINEHAASRGQLVDAEFRARALADATQVIQAMPVAPPLGNTNCPHTWVKCLMEWRGHNLQYWLTDDGKGWHRSLRNAYNKRRSIHAEIERYRDTENAEGDMSRPMCSLDGAAAALETLRRDGRLNLTDHFNSRRKANPGTQRRFRRSNNPHPPPQPPPPPHHHHLLQEQERTYSIRMPIETAPFLRGDSTIHDYNSLPHLTMPLWKSFMQ
jgi:hypothetical protein